MLHRASTKGRGGSWTVELYLAYARGRASARANVSTCIPQMRTLEANAYARFTPLVQGGFASAAGSSQDCRGLAALTGPRQVTGTTI